MSAENIILGIDPGTNVMGFGLIASQGNRMKLIMIDELLLNKLDSHALRLKKIFEKTLALIDEYHPDEISIEAPFFGKMCNPCLSSGGHRA